MRYSRTGDQLAEAIAYVASRALWLAHINGDGSNRGREREMGLLKVLLDRLAEEHPASFDEAMELAHENHAYCLQRDARRC